MLWVFEIPLDLSKFQLVDFAVSSKHRVKIIENESRENTTRSVVK